MKDGSWELRRDGAKDETLESRRGRGWAKDGNRELRREGAKDGTWESGREGAKDGTRELRREGAKDETRESGREGAKDETKASTCSKSWYGIHELSFSETSDETLEPTHNEINDGILENPVKET